MLSAIATTTVLASLVIGLSTDTNAATRHRQHRAPHHYSYRAYNAFGAFHSRRDAHPVSGTPRWNAAGGGAP
jgi:hypothetical protein